MIYMTPTESAASINASHISTIAKALYLEARGTMTYREAITQARVVVASTR